MNQKDLDGQSNLTKSILTACNCSCLQLHALGQVYLQSQSLPLKKKKVQLFLKQITKKIEQE